MVDGGEAYPTIKAVCTTLREVKAAWSTIGAAFCGMRGKFYEARQFKDWRLGPVGGGDGFSSELRMVF